MKKKWFLPILATVLVVICLLSAGCSQPKIDLSEQGSMATATSRQTPAIVAPSSAAQSSADVLDYFPMDTGSEWTYYITTGNVNPVIHEKVFIVQDKDIYSFPYRKIFHPVAGQVYVLKIRVKGPFRGGQRLNSVDLEILKDDMGLFRDTTGVFWGIMDNPSGRGLQAMELAASYSADKLAETYPYPELKQATLIHSYRMIFIWDGSKLQSEDGESVSYLGIDNNVAGYYGTPCYHFLREVPATKTSVPGFNAFTEHTWYAKGKGLVRLEQKIDGQTSMVWTLNKFTPGGK